MRQPATSADVAIVGGGIVGLATGLRLLEARPDLRLVVLEKEPDVATHQSARNSGVVHAGLYYTPGSTKARLCIEGKLELERYCEARSIPLERLGKLVVALTEDELAGLERVRERAEANGVPGLEVVGPERIREIEPHAVGLRALWSPNTGVVDFRRVALAYAADIRAAGGTIETGREVTGVRAGRDEVVLETAAGPLTARTAIACAGLHADRLAAMAGSTGDDAAPEEASRIVPFRGDYYTLRPDAAHLVRGLIYPVPDPRFPFLGVHLTRRVDGSVLAGPNAVLAFAREGYRRRDVGLGDLGATLRDPGFRRLALRHWRSGLAELWRDWSKRAFVAEVRRYVPALQASDMTFGPSGVRAQAVARDGRLIDDFEFGGSGRFLVVRNAPSPAATSSLAIGRVLASMTLERLDPA